MGFLEDMIEVGLLDGVEGMEVVYFELDELEGLAEGLAVDGMDVGDILGTFVG